MLFVLLTGIIIRQTLATSNQCVQNYCTNNLFEKLAPLQIKCTNVEKKYTALEKQNDALLRILKTLNQTVEKLSESTKEQREINTQLKEANEHLKKALQNQTLNVKAILLNNKTGVIDEIEQKVLSFIDAELGAAENIRIGFSASLTGTISSNSPRTVVFNKVVTNVGNTYNATTGIFKAPVNGMYLFSATFMTYRIYAQLEIFKNSDRVGKIFANGNDGRGTQDMSTKTVIFDLQKDDEVYVKLTSSTGSGGYVVAGDEYSSFSGVLVE